MSNYRRLISYIYAYEGAVKGKNIGFAKLESRNGQCRINVSVKKVYVGGNDMGVYLLSDTGELFLGKIFIRSGNGEFRITVRNDDVEGSGKELEHCYGLTIHDMQDNWRAYTTIWDDTMSAQETEDTVTHAAEVELADLTSENLKKQIEEDRSEVTPFELFQAPPPQMEVPEKTEEKPEITEKNVTGNLPGGSYQELMEEMERKEADLPGFMMESSPVSRYMSGAAKARDAAEKVREEREVELPKEPEEAPEGAEALEPETEPETVWSDFRKRYPKMDAFDYENGCEILKIKPQDIGLLPRENWTYGNNSFLLHGYYNYRCLILVRLNNPGGYPRYLLGVPGHYFSNEKYMASMFGFPHFVLSKKQPIENGRFGYWYTDVRLG